MIAPAPSVGANPERTSVDLAILTSSLPPYPIGGAERQAEETARRLVARGHRVTVYARRVPAGAPLREERDGVVWIRCAAPGIPGLSFAGHLLSFRRAFAAEPRPQVVLAYQTVINGVLGAAATGHVPLVTWIRSEREVQPARSAKYRLLTPWVLRRSQRVLVQGKAIRETLLAGWPGNAGSGDRLRERLHILGNALETGPDPTYTDRRGLVTVGRLEPVKGTRWVLDALRRIPDPPPLTVIGAGSERALLEQAAAGLPVTFAGRVEPAAIRDRIAGARILVSGSESEGFPNAILEGMERGVPTVATAVGGVPSVVRHEETGLLVPPRDPKALARAIQELYGDDARWERMARAARAAAADYGWDPHLQKLEAILEAVVTGR